MADQVPVQDEFRHGATKGVTNDGGAVSFIFSVTNKVGALEQALAVVRECGLDMKSIESRPSATSSAEYDFFVTFETATNDQLADLTAALQKKRLATEAKVVGDAPTRCGSGGSEGLLASSSVSSMPWFPRKVADLDQFAHKVLAAGGELEADHPGFKDAVYRARREEITRIAQTYRHGERIPRIDYTPAEIETWGVVYRRLRGLYPKYACRQMNYVFPLLEANCSYSETSIPQLQDISDFLMECTGFSLRPVTGLLSPRDFLNGLAFRVFHSTQYIRHHSKPLYTPEPDVCHELMGHVPLFCDPEFADFSQVIGLASLGASDDDITRLATCYWFTVEFGMCMEGTERKAFGAGLLSSFGELAYCVGEDPEQKPNYEAFEPAITALREYPITTYQPTYFVADSFNRAKDQMVAFAATLQRPFAVRYNPFTRSVEVLNNRASLKRFVSEIESAVKTLNHAMDTIPGIQ